MSAGEGEGGTVSNAGWLWQGSERGGGGVSPRTGSASSLCEGRGHLGSPNGPTEGQIWGISLVLVGHTRNLYFKRQVKFLERGRHPWPHRVTAKSGTPHQKHEQNHPHINLCRFFPIALHEKPGTCLVCRLDFLPALQ